MIVKLPKYYFLLLFLAGTLRASAQGRDSTLSAPGFISNRGQWLNGSEFLSSFHGTEVYFERNAFQYFFQNPGDRARFFDHKTNPHLLKPYVVRRHAVRMTFENASGNTVLSGRQPHLFHLNFIQGNDPARWKSHVPVYRNIFYEGLYAGIDMGVFQGNGNGLKYEFYVAAGADPSRISMSYEGAEKLYLRNGNLHVRTSVNSWVESQPYAYQRINGMIREVPCRYVVSGNTVSFELGVYSPTDVLVIDPVLVFSTYSGSSSDNFGHTATYDNNGNLYTAGIVESPSSFPSGKYPVTAGAFQTTFGGGRGSWPQAGFPCDIGISKYNNDGSQLMYATYFGGNRNDYPISLVVDNHEQLILLGATLSADFPVTPHAHDTSKSDSFDVVVARFTAGGNALVGSSYFGSTGIDGLNIADTLRMNYSDEFRGEVLVTNRSEVVFVSSTTSTGLATAGSLQPAIGGRQDGIIVKMDSALTRVIRCSYLGKNAHDALYSLDIDRFGHFVVAGGTQSTNFSPSPGAAWANYKGGISEGFVARVDSSLSNMLSMRYWGSPGYDQVHFVKLDPQEYVVVFGQTYDSVGVTQGTYSNNRGTLFVTRFTPNLWDVTWSTQLGSGLTRNALSPSAFMVDVCGNVYGSVWGGRTNLSSRYSFLHPNQFASSTSSLPVTPNAIQSSTDGSDFWLFCLKPDADSLSFATFFGEPGGEDHVDGGTSRFDKRGIVYQSVCASCGSGLAGTFPTTPQSYSPTNPSLRCSNASFKIDFRQDNVVTADFAVSPRNGCTDSVFTFSNRSHNGTLFYWYLNGTLIDSAINPAPGYGITQTISVSGTYSMKLLVIDTARCNLKDSITKTFTVLPSSHAAFSITKDTCSPLLFFRNESTFANNESGPFTWYFGDGNTSTSLNPVHRYASNGTYTVRLITSEGGQCADTAMKVIVYDTLQYELKADFAARDTLRCEPTLLRMTNSGRNGTSFKWYVNGVLVSTSSSGFDSIAQKGNYRVRLVVYDSTTCTRSDSVERMFYVVPPTYADFDWTIDSCRLGVQFGNRSIIAPGDTASYHWDFGDGTFSADSAPYHDYPDTGTYTVTLRANRDFPCSEVMVKEVRVVPGTSVLKAVFTLEPPVLCEPDTFTATDKSYNAEKIYWYIAGILKDSSPVFRDVISYPGTTELMLVASNDNTCRSHDTARMFLPSFTASDAAFSVKRDSCSPALLLNNLSSTAGQGPLTYQWFFGDGNATTDENPRHEYTNDGTYTIMLITNPGTPCSDTATQEVVYKRDQHLLEAGFLLDDTLACTPAIIRAARTGVNGKHFYWFLNDTPAGSDSLFTDTLQAAGSYSLKLVAIDSSSCLLADTFEKRINVSLFTRAAFSIERDSCSLDVQFVNLSEDNGNTFTWYFGDGDSSSLRNPGHRYRETGTYTIRLVYGAGTHCADTAGHTHYIDGDSSQEVIIPNVFTPNGDGLNDCFRVTGVSEKCDEFRIIVYNRWGLEVYRDTNGQNCWNGKDQHGSDLPQGVYYYIMLINKRDGYKLNDRGTITLIRE